MQMLFCTLFSGSSGNCLFIGTEKDKILIDAGVSASRTVKELEAIGVDIHDIKALLVTHEHSDHISGVGVLSRKYGLPVYATPGTWRGMSTKIGNISPYNHIEIDPEQDFYIGELSISPFPIPHDANEPCGYVVRCRRASVAVATDIGCIRKSWLEVVSQTSSVLLESNYDSAMLSAGSYTYELKRRIQGTKGHLSNDDAAQAALELANRGVQSLILGHLSKENNFPELAYQSVIARLREAGYDPEAEGRPHITLAPRDGHGALHVIETD